MVRSKKISRKVSHRRTKKTRKIRNTKRKKKTKRTMKIRHKRRIKKIYGGAESEDKEGSKICSICLDEINNDHNNVEGIKLQCGHFFHIKCLSEWTIGQNKTKCPYCRAEIDNNTKSELTKNYSERMGISQAEIEESGITRANMNLVDRQIQEERAADIQIMRERQTERQRGRQRERERLERLERARLERARLERERFERETAQIELVRRARHIARLERQREPRNNRIIKSLKNALATMGAIFD